MNLIENSRFMPFLFAISNNNNTKLKINILEKQLPNIGFSNIYNFIDINYNMFIVCVDCRQFLTGKWACLTK